MILPLLTKIVCEYYHSDPWSPSVVVSWIPDKKKWYASINRYECKSANTKKRFYSRDEVKAFRIAHAEHDQYGDDLLRELIRSFLRNTQIESVETLPRLQPCSICNGSGQRKKDCSAFMYSCYENSETCICGDGPPLVPCDCQSTTR